jgi:hypothetical protein
VTLRRIRSSSANTLSFRVTNARAEIARSVGQVARRSVIGPAASRFHEAFAEWLDVLRQPCAMDCVLKERLIPSVPVTARVFIGCRLALVRGKPWLAGR